MTLNSQSFFYITVRKLFSVNRRVRADHCESEIRTPENLVKISLCQLVCSSAFPAYENESAYFVL
jgi:hypothetical protein